LFCLCREWSDCLCWISGRLCALDVSIRGCRHRPGGSHWPAYSPARGAPTHYLGACLAMF
jgi:hypothetical protein